MGELDPLLIRNLALAGDDFGFEMRVGKVLRSVPVATVDHGGTYRPVGMNQAQRQYDYRFRASNGNKTLQLTVECKNLFIGSPAVVCGSQRSLKESRLEMLSSDALITVDAYDKAEQQVISLTLVDTPSEFYPVGDFVGKAILRPDPTSKARELVPGSEYKVTGDSDIYDRWNQAVLHSCVILQRATNFWHETGKPCFCVTLPIVVVPDSTLWVIPYDESGLIISDPKKVDACTVYCGCPVNLGGPSSYNQRSVISHIHFYTLTGLTQLMSLLADENSKLWDQLFPASRIQQYMTDRNKPVRI